MVTPALLQPDTILTPEHLKSVSPTFLTMGMQMIPSKIGVSDIEGDNLLERLTKFHCGVIVYPFTLEERIYGPEDSSRYLQDLDRLDVLVGHNFRGFDLLALKKLFDYDFGGMFCFDTLVLSRLVNPERKQHSLKAWGQQLHFYKGEYKDEFKARMGDKYVDGMEWWDFNPYMMDYNVQDGRLNAVIFLYFLVQLKWWERYGVTKEQCLHCIEQIRGGNLRRV